MAVRKVGCCGAGGQSSSGRSEMLVTYCGYVLCLQSASARSAVEARGRARHTVPFPAPAAIFFHILEFDTKI